MTALLTALSSGISAKKILEFLMRKSPEMHSRITQALASGLSADKVVKFFSNPRNFEKLKSEMDQEYLTKFNANPLVQAQNVRSQNLGSDMASGLQRSIGPALGTAAALGTSYALSRAIPPILQKGKALLGQTIQAGTQSKTPSIQQTLQPPVNPVNQVGTNISQTAPQVQPEGISNSKEYLENLGIKGEVDSLLKAGNTPEAVAATIGIKGGKGKVKGAIDPELLSHIENYAKENVSTTVPTEKMPNVQGEKNAQAAPEQLQVGAPVEPISKELDEVTEAQQEPQKLEKGATVATPIGVGEIKAIKEKSALVEVDGKTHRVPIDELEQESPDIAQLYDELFEALPPEHKSRMMNFAGYDEANNELLFRPHGGGAYVYKDIPKEFADALKAQLHLAKTTGKNMYGMWNEGDPSYGAGMSKLIKELQASYGGKGKEYIRKYETLFDILGLPHELKKRKEKEEREKRKKK